MSASNQKDQEPRLEQAIEQVIAPWKKQWLDRKIPYEVQKWHTTPPTWSVGLIYRTRKAKQEAYDSGIFSQMEAAIRDAVNAMNKASQHEPLLIDHIGLTSQADINARHRYEAKQNIYGDLIDQVVEPVKEQYRDWLSDGGTTLHFGRPPHEQALHVIFPTRAKQAEAEAQGIPAKIEAALYASLARVNASHSRKPLVLYIGFANVEDVIEGGGPYNYFR
jgi:hypothetical protein